MPRSSASSGRRPALDAALLTAAEEIKPQLAQFRADHRKQLELGPKQYLAALLIVAAILALCAMLWDSGLGT